jgi:hypothetical protein
MTRSELYRLVWNKPMKAVAAELGVSGVAVGKACRRHNIPTPGRGHWALVAAGHATKRQALPAGEDVEFSIGTAAKEQRQYLQVARSPVDVPMPVPADLSRAHPLVIATARLFAEAEKDEQRVVAATARGKTPPYRRHAHRIKFGRYTTDRAFGLLQISATLHHIDWILRFHEALLRAVESAGCKVEPTRERYFAHIDIVKGGERTRLTFTEGYRKTPNRKGEPLRPYTYTRRDVFTVRLRPELPIASSNPKAWSGDIERLERLLPDIVRTAAEWPSELAVQRQAWQAKLAADKAAYEAARRREFERAEQCERAQERLAARLAEASAVVDAMQQAKRNEEIIGALLHIEDLARGRPEADALRTWSSVVRGTLRDPWAALIARVAADAAAPNRPLWWPAPTDAPDAHPAASAD